MIKNYFLFILGILLFSSGYSQGDNQENTDSLKKLTQLSSDALNQYDYSNSIDYALKLIALASKEEDKDYLYYGYNFLGINFEDLEDSTRARESYTKALEVAFELKNDTILMGAYNNLGNIYSENKKTVEKGLEYYNKAIEIGRDFEDSLEIFTPVINIGWTYLDNHQYDLAFPYLERANGLLGEKHGRISKSQLLTLFGKYYSGKGDLEQAKTFFETSLEIAEKDSLLIEASFAYEEYAEMLLKSNDYKNAFHALEKHKEYQKKIFKEEKIHQQEAAYARFGMEESKKKLELAQREQEYKDEVIAKTKQVSVILVISVGVMLLFLIIIFRNNRIRKKLIRQLKGKNTELVLAKEEAERLSSLKTKFFSTVSHELRTPLYGVVGLTSLLLEDNTNKKQVEDLNSLKFSADYLLALINDVLQMNKMESRIVQLENMPFKMEELTRGIVKSFEFTRNQNQNELELSIDENIPGNLIGDSVRLSQVLMNLVGNAIKFTERGKVWIKAELKKRENKSCFIYFEIGDTGLGIPPNKQKEIFEEFSQLRGNNYNYQGTGLGLSIVKKLLDLFGSEIHLKSEEGKGSVFSFEICFEEGEISGEGTSEIQNVFEAGSYKKALVVDDNKINQVVTQRILEKKDFKCQVAASGLEAIEILKADDFDLVLMDVNMPGLNGMETTMEVRKFNKDIPIIALTAVEIDEMRQEILKSGMNDIIIKPYDTHQFFHTVFKNLLVSTP